MRSRPRPPSPSPPVSAPAPAAAVRQQPFTAIDPPTGRPPESVPTAIRTTSTSPRLSADATVPGPSTMPVNTLAPRVPDLEQPRARPGEDGRAALAHERALGA